MKRWLTTSLDFVAIFLMVAAVAFVAWVLLINAMGCAASTPDPVGSEIEWWNRETKWPDENYSARGER
jgi:hypothetical protein